MRTDLSRRLDVAPIAFSVISVKLTFYTVSSVSSYFNDSSAGFSPGQGVPKTKLFGNDFWGLLRLLTRVLPLGVFRFQGAGEGGWKPPTRNRFLGNSSICSSQSCFPSSLVALPRLDEEAYA